MSTTPASAQSEQIDVADLDIPQLANVRKQLEDELTHWTTSFQQLKQAQSKFRTCIDNVKDVGPEHKDKVILVPLTNSLYVPGKLADHENVIVDVGTGYYVKKTRTQAQTHYKSKVEQLQSNLVMLQENMQKKQDNLSYVNNLIQAKLQAQVASGSGGGKVGKKG